MISEGDKGDIGEEFFNRESQEREAQYLTPASMQLLLGQFPLQALDLRVQLSLKSTQLRDQTGLTACNGDIGKVNMQCSDFSQGNEICVTWM